MLPYRHSIDACFTAAIGEYGIKDFTFVQALAKAEAVLDQFRHAQHESSRMLLTLPAKADDLNEIEAVAQRIRSEYEQVIIFGTGGSTLTGQALCGLRRKPTLPLYFMDNIDPHTTSELLEQLAPERTAILSISKSGTTLETVAQTLIGIEWLATKIDRTHLGKQCFMISDPGDNALRRIGFQIGATILDHEPKIGGRFAALTNVGLLPAALAGLNVRAFRTGAAAVVQQALGKDSEPAKGAALSAGLMQVGYRTSVMMPYVDRLVPFTQLYRQLWAESLGKNGMGSTPIASLGTLDQHSQLQLYLDGPRDKMFTLILLEHTGKGPLIVMDAVQEPSFSYLHHKRLGDVIAAEQEATVTTLTRHNRPVRTFTLNDMNEEVMGALVMHMMLETIITAAILGVNAFDQPAVEQGKILARRLLGTA